MSGQGLAWQCGYNTEQILKKRREAGDGLGRASVAGQ